MKSRFTYLFILAASLTIVGCSKTESTPQVSPEQQVVNYLVGTGNRYWRLSKVYVNGVQQALTDAQMKYYKVYTINPAITLGGTFTDSDGFSGTWQVKGTTTLRETVSNNPSGPVQLSYDLNQITETNLDYENTQNMKTVRYVFYAN
jgi:uncharacterized protein YcfL